MSKQGHRSGGKFCGNHTTLIPAAVVVADIAEQCPEVIKLSLGVISMSKSVSSKGSSRRHVKIIDEDWGVLLTIRDGNSAQELRVYVTNQHKAKLSIAEGARNAKQRLSISFGTHISTSA